MNLTPLTRGLTAPTIGAGRCLKIHILNVGHGSCAIVEHPSGRLTVMDINNGTDIDEDSFKEVAAELGISSFDLVSAPYLAESRQQFLESKGYDIGLTNPIEYFQKHFPGRRFWRFILSHPDLDHMRGLVALKNTGHGIVNFWDTEHKKVPEEFHGPGDEEEWAEYERLRGGKENRVLRLGQDQYGQLYNRDESGNEPGDGIQILAPISTITQAENAKETPNYNNLSYVLSLRFGGRRVIMGGDAEQAVWESLHANFGDGLKCDVLVAPHHGRSSAYYQPAVKAMSPEYTIVSVGEKPKDGNDASRRYAQYSDNVWSTRWRGNITVEIWENGVMNVASQYKRPGQSMSGLDHVITP